MNKLAKDLLVKVAGAAGSTLAVYGMKAGIKLIENRKKTEQ